MFDLTNVKDSEVENALKQSEGLVLVDFWADWCAPCAALSPVLQDIATTYTGEVSVVKINVEHLKDIADSYHIRALPTLVLLKNGTEITRVGGSITKTRIANLLDDALTEV